jgi:hypothetical protein
MPCLARLAAVAAMLAACACPLAHAAPKTVCTVTVNSPDEQELMKRRLPPGDYRFVELVERGRPDWLASSCSAGTRCDVLVISGHFDDGTQFYSDRVDSHDQLPVSELERASCSSACAGLFSNLKEVYLFGCNTLSPQPLKAASAEVTRSLLRSGHGVEEAERLTRALDAVHGRSNRDRMREIFHDVPVIYGFSSKAPLGRSAAATLERYFDKAPAGEIGSGVPSAQLLAAFAPVSMTATTGVRPGEAQAAVRDDVCRLVGDGPSPGQQAAFVHAVLDREMAEVRPLLDRLEHYAASLDDATRAAPGVADALAAIAHDVPARARFLAFARDADDTRVRLRMLDLARKLDWLDAAQYRHELVALIHDRLAARSAGSGDVDLVCAVSGDRALDTERARLAAQPDAGANAQPGQAAMLACLGSTGAQARVLHALASGNAADVEVAQVYLRHRPLTDLAAIRALAHAVAGMSRGDAQVRALDTLAQLPVDDRESLDELVRLYTRASSVGVQRAVAGILVRADTRVLARPDLVRTLQQHRIKSTDGRDMVDVLLRRLQSAGSDARAPAARPS